LRGLFRHLNTDHGRAKTKPKEHFKGFQYVNGGLFNDTDECHSAIPEFSAKSRLKLIELGNKQWKDINPDIFGSMFQSVVDDEKRAELGMHYTSVPNIMKVIKPLFLDDLYEELEKAKGSETKLKKLQARLYKMRFFDPACGSGNFLIIAYKELRRFEMALFRALDAVGTHSLLTDDQAGFDAPGFRPAIEQQSLAFRQASLHMPGIHVSQFYGIELDDFAHEVAILALWLAEHQMNLEFRAAFGNAPPSLPLKDGAKIVCDNALRREWRSVCRAEDDSEVFVLGTPPYYGARKQTSEQKSDVVYVAGRLDGHKSLDYIACFFLKAADYIRETNAEVAFVATNSICQGEQVALLWPHVVADLEFHFAYQSFKWSNSAKANAGVTCVIIGIRRSQKKPKRLFRDSLVRNVENINPYLVPGRVVFISRRSTQICNGPKMGIGNKPIDDGNYTLTPTQRNELMASEPAVKPYIFKWLGSLEYFKGITRYCVLPQRIPANQLRDMPRVTAMIERVRFFRSQSPSKPTREFASRPTEFHVENFPESDFLAIPKVSSERRHYIPADRLAPTTVCSDLMNVVSSSDMYIFALISSQMHMVWVRAVAGRLEERIRYSSSICYNNFPFPLVDAHQKKALAQSAEAILIERERYPEKSMAWLYDPKTMPDDLLAAHQALDLAVEKSYRDKSFTSDEERLEYLFALYEKMTTDEEK
jgi:hypothetical protein